MPNAGDFDAADDRTLRLSAPALTTERLDRYIAFQRALSAAPLSADPQVVAAAHAEAIRTSGLSPREASEIDAVVRDFSGRRAVERRLRERLGTAEGDKRARVEKELRTRNDDADLERRYGQAVLQALRAREEALLALHLERAR